MNRWIDPHWRDFLKLHSTWVALFWFCFYGAYMALPAFSSQMTPQTFAALCMFSTVTWGIARLTNQPGTQL